ncbi:MAG: radical SAM protein [bacterium]|nr:radical SAM protein [bacterium]
MAIGWSGSNGGITQNYKPISAKDLRLDYIQQMNFYPLEVSYFINNRCNLQCRHCYVGYENGKDSLSIKDWRKVFDECIEIGGLTFGNVGKEPLLSWQKTKNLLLYFKEQREEKPKLRFGLVTNGLLLNEKKIEEINKINPDYMDISLDGTEKVHNAIRGKDTYNKLMANLLLLSRYDLLKKVFVSFTINRLNCDCIAEVVETVYKIGIRNFLLSPFITLNTNEELYLADMFILPRMNKLVQGDLIDFSQYDDLNIYVKNNFSSPSSSLMVELVNERIIDKKNIFIDEYGVIFNKYSFNGNTVYFNYLPWDNAFVQAIRISHDGYISNCYDMFFKDYPNRTVGNVREKSIREILRIQLSPFGKGGANRNRR